jgi:methylmalonyl-CoA mutase cobalamin-binding subunit
VGDDEARSNRAGQAVWHEAPEQFPEYVATLYANQPSEQTEWATVDTLVSFADEAGVEDTDAVRESITTGEYTELWQTTQDLVEEKGIRGIPRLELGGEITAPTINPGATERQLKQTLE